MKKFQLQVRTIIEHTVTVQVEAEDAETACDQVELMPHNFRASILNSVTPVFEVVECEEIENKQTCMLEVVQ